MSNGFMNGKCCQNETCLTSLFGSILTSIRDHCSVLPIYPVQHCNLILFHYRLKIPKLDHQVYSRNLLIPTNDKRSNGTVLIVKDDRTRVWCVFSPPSSHSLNR